MAAERSAETRVHGATAAHLKVIRADGRIEHHTSFSRPRPFYNLRAWLWLGARYIEYRRRRYAS